MQLPNARQKPVAGVTKAILTSSIRVETWVRRSKPVPMGAAVKKAYADVRNALGGPWPAMKAMYGGWTPVETQTTSLSAVANLKPA